MSSKGLQYYLTNLNPEMVTYARELRGLTKKELAEQLNKTPATLTRIEKGNLRPELETFFTLTRVLQIEPSFLARSPGDFPSFDDSRIHFRGQRKVSATQKRMLIREGEAAYDLLQYFSKRGINYPTDALGDFTASISTHYDIEKLALDVRNALGLGFGPIANLTHLLESIGAFVIILGREEDINVDAFSSIIGKRHCIIVFQGDSASRTLFSIAHEVGHLLLHEYTDGSMQQEREANRFASSFLLPWKTFKEECPRRWNIHAFIQMKRRWRVSIGAMLYRARQLSVFSESSYIRAIQNMKERGIAISEPAEPEFETPVIFAEALRILLDKGMTLTEVSHELGQPRNRILSILRNQCVDDPLLAQFSHGAFSDGPKLLHFSEPPAFN